jgi:hypothetical protein
VTLLRTRAWEFFERGQALLPAIVDVAVGATLAPALRLTSTLAWLWEAADGRIELDGQEAERLWEATHQATVIRTFPFPVRLPELQLELPTSSLVVIGVGGELGFAERDPAATVPPPATFVIRGGPWPRGALLFDDAWRFVGFHMQDSGGIGACVSAASLLASLEPASCWDEIAAAHRLARTRIVPSATRSRVVPDLERAVRWDPRGDPPPMPARERRRTLRRATLAELRAARGASPATGPEQQAIDTLLLTDPPFNLENTPLDQLLAFATAASWFADVVPGLPARDKLDRLIMCRRQLAALDDIIGPRFAPRIAEERHLESWLADRHRPPLVLRGPGGIGKSALIAKFVRWAAVERAKLPRARFVWLDFDRPDLNHAEETILESARQQLRWQGAAGTLIIVLDSFETAVQGAGYERFNRTLDTMASEFGNNDAGVIVGSRAPAPILRVGQLASEDHEIAGLPADITRQWLLEEKVAAPVCDRVATVTRGVPLNVKLAVELLAGKPDAEAETIVDELPNHLITGYLYRRILSRLADESLGKLAPWMMVPRRLQPELVARILPLIEGDASDAGKLFDSLKREVTLLTGDAELSVRPDLRNTILPLLETENAAWVDDIDAVAAAYWKERAVESESAAAEAIYHALRRIDLVAADLLWRPGVEPYLRGYAVEEISPAARTWLEGRLVTDEVATRVEDLLARGRLADARRELGGYGRETYEASVSARTRRLLGFVPDPDLVNVDRAGLEGLESAFVAEARPALRVRGNELAETSNRWRHLFQAPDVRAVLGRCLSATGRLQLVGTSRRIVGTATLVGPGLFLTTASAVEEFVVGRGREVVLVREKQPVVDLLAEGHGVASVVRIDRAVMVHPYWDIALLATSDPVAGAPVALATAAPAEGTHIVAIGHPGEPASQFAHLRHRIYGDVVDVKRVMPGALGARATALSLGIQVEAAWEDSSTLSPDPGAAIFDPASGALLGVRFGSINVTSNAFVPAWELVSDPAIAQTGVRMTSPPPPGRPSWLASWRRGLDARTVLLDAFLAWREGDPYKTKALVESLAMEDSLTADERIDRTLLGAAVMVRENPARAGAFLEALIESQPPLSGADTLAVVATRLRLAVEADTERALLESTGGDQRRSIDVATRTPFRVFAPQPRWTWRSTAPASDGGDPQGELIARLQRLDGECARLAPWIDRHAAGIQKLIVDRAEATLPDGVDALVAACVAFPRAQLADLNRAVTARFALRPHPKQGWAPLYPALAPGRVGSLPVPSTGQDVWLDARSSDQSLMRLFADAIGVDTDVCWAAGLLHLLTPVPLEQLLDARFTRRNSAGASVTSSGGALNLDQAPYPWHLPAAQELHSRLVDSFYDPAEIRHLLQASGIDVYSIDVNQSVTVIWREALTSAAAHGGVRRLLRFIVDASAAAPATRDYLNALLAGRAVPSATAETRSSSSKQLDVSPQEVSLLGDDLSEAIGEVPNLVAAIRRVMEHSSAVCRVQVTLADGLRLMSTGSLVRGGRILTAANVLGDQRATVTKVTAEFFYELDARGQARSSTVVDCDVTTFVSDRADGWVIIRPLAMPDDVVPVDLDTSRLPTRGDRLFILHHPEGRPKRLGYVRNVVTEVVERRIRYLADTSPGTSGALIFDGAGRPIALHRAAGQRTKLLGQPATKPCEGVRADLIATKMRELNLRS